MEDEETLRRALPPFLAAVARVAGLDAALRLGTVWGGQKRYIPPHPKEGNAIVAVVGLEAAVKISAFLIESRHHWTGADLDIPQIPSATKKMAILREDGATRDVARRMGVSERYVRYVRNQAYGPFADRKRRKTISNGGLTGGVRPLGYPGKPR